MKNLRRYRTSLGGFMTALVAIWQTCSPMNLSAATYIWDAGSATDLAWSTSTNWSANVEPTASDDVTFPVAIPNPGPLSNPGTITLSSGEVAKSLLFQNNYTLTGGDLTLTSGFAQVDSGSYSSIASVIHGSAGLTKAGNGTLRLSGVNDYTGQTVIERGALVITNSSALGSDPSAIIINGFSGRAVQGGQLVVAPTFTPGSIQGMTFARSIALSGRGPSMDGAALLSIGNNTFSGNIFTSTLGESRIGSAYGTTTFSGNFNITNVAQNLVLVGNGNFKMTGALGAGANGNDSGLVKSGNGGLDLTGLTDNNILGKLQIDSGTVRVSNGSQVGRSTRSNALLPNGGTLEIRSDAGNTFSSVLSTLTNNGTGILLDRAIAGTGSLNQTVTMGNMFSNDNQTATIAGRNGVNLILPTLTVGTAGGNGAGLTYNGNGLLTASSLIFSSTGTSKGMTLTTTGDALVTGSFGMTNGVTPTITKAGAGMLTLLGTNTSTSTYAFTIGNGTLSVANLTNATTATGGMNIGSGGTSGILNYLGAGGGALYGGTGAGETDSRILNVNGTANNAIFANQAGSGASALTISNLTVSAATSNSLYLGGSNTSLNTITSVIPVSTALTVGKIGLGTWVLSGNNLYTGNTAIYGGTLIIDGSSATGVSDKLKAGAIIFNSNGTSAAVSTTAGTGGWTGDNTAGGSFVFKGSASASGTQETLGALTPSAGLGNVVIDTTSASGTSLTFASLGTRGANSQLNFTPNSGAINFTAAVAGTNNIVGGFATLNGVDFVGSVGAGGSVAAATYTALPTTVGSAAANYISAGSTPTTGGILANSLKINGGGTVSGTGALTITAASATSLGGILFDNSGGAGGISGFTSITTSTAGQELIFYTGGSTPTNEFTVASVLANGAGSVTKGGTGTMVLSGNNTFTGNLFINEGTLKASGATANLLGTISNVANITSIRQTGTLDINGAGTSLSAYGTVNLNTVVVGALAGAGANTPTLAKQTTLSGAATNSNTITVADATGIAIGQTVTSVGATPIGGYPVVTGISGTTITLSSPQTFASGSTVNFVSYTTSGATITNSGANSAISLGTSTSTGTQTYNGLIKDGAGTTTVIVNGAATRFQSLTGYNTYTGATIISGGSTLRVTNLADGGVASAIGASSNAAGNLVFNNGVLQYLGSTNGNGNIFQMTTTPSVSTDRLFTIAGSATIDSSATYGNNFLTGATQSNSALVFSNTGAVSYANTTAAPRTLTLTGNSIGDNQINLQLVDNGANALSLTKAGNSLWILGGTSNTYSGATTISAGQLRAQDGTSLSATSNLVLNGGVLESSGTFTRALGTTAGTQTVQWTSATANGGFAASNAKLTVNLGSGVTLAFATASFTSGQLILGSSTSLAETEFQNNLNLNGGTRTITVSDNGNTALDFTTLSGVISNSTGTGNLVINANAPTYLIGANTYNGTTTFNSGSTFVTSLGNSVTNPGAATSVGTASAATTAGLLFGNGGTGATMTYVGAGETSDRAWGSTATTGGISIDSSGSGALVLTGTFTHNNAAAGSNKTLSLNGLNTDYNTITSDLKDNTGNTGTLGITKNGGGIWILSGNNGSMTGTISLTGGILGVGSNNALGTGAISWNNGGLMAVGADRTLANLATLNNNNTWNVLGNNSITFSNVVTWAPSANSNSFVNNIVAGKSLTFNNGFNQTGTTGFTITFEGSGATIINGAVTQTNNTGMAYSGRPGGSLTFGGTGTNTITGTFTQNSGTVNINRVGAFTSNSSYSFVGGYIENTSGSALTGANALIGATLTTGANSGAAGIFNLNGTLLYLQGSGPFASIEIAGQFNNAGATNRQIFNNITGGSMLILSGTVNLSSDSTNRILTLGGIGDTLLYGIVTPSSLAGNTNVGGTWIKNNTGDLNISPTSAPNVPMMGNLVVNGGTVTFNSSSTNAFSMARIDVNAGGTLIVDNSISNVTGRTGAGAYRSIGLNGGTFNFTANTAAGTAETVGTLYLGSATNQGGGSTFNFINGGAVNSSLAFGGLIQNNFTSLNIVASSLGSTNKVFVPGLLNNAGFGINSRVLINGSEFATNSANGVVAYSNYITTNNLDNTQTLSILPQLDNFNISANPTFTGATITGQNKTINGLKISGAGTTVGATGLYTLTVSGGGILATGTGEQITAPVLAFGGTEGIFHVATGADLTVSSAITGSAGFTKADGGTLTLNGPVYTTGNFAINGGTLKMGSSLAVFPTATTQSIQSLFLNGGTFDLNGYSQVFANLIQPDPNAGAAGNITNSSTTTPVNLIINHASAQTYGGVISNAVGGDLSYYHMGNFTSTFTNASTFTGSTNVFSGTVTLRDSGAFTNTSAVNVNFATLQFDNTGLNDLSNRINSSAAVTLNGGAIRLDGAMSSISQQAIGAVSAVTGLNTLSANTNGSGGSFLTLAGLTRSTGTMVNFTGNSLGTLYNNSQSGRIVIGGQADGFMGGWATVGGTEFATYISAVDTATVPNLAQGVTALQAYTTVADPYWTSADNVKLANNTGATPATYTLGGNRTINSLNIQAATNPITVTNTGNTLTLNSGGFLYNGVDGGIFTGGNLTSGGSDLYIYAANNLTISSQITGASMNLVMAAPGKTLTLTPTTNNTYGSTSGTTYFNAGTLTFGSSAGVITIPTNLVVNNAAVTFTQFQQLAAGKDLTINGSGGNITFVGGTGAAPNVLGAVTFNNMGGATTPTITGGVISMTSLTSVNNNLTTTPTISSTVELGGSTLTIDTSGLSADSLSITGTIQNTTGTAGIIKTGTGSLVLTGTNTFNGNVNLNQGTIIVNTSASALGSGQLSMANNTSLMSGSASVTLLNQINVNGNIALGGPASGNNINLGGVVALGGSSRTITIASPNSTVTLSGTLTGTQVLNKAGLGILALTGGTLNYTPGINLNAGVIALDQTLASFSSSIATSAGTVVSLNSGGNGSIGVNVNPGANPFAISGAGQVIKTGAFALNMFGNFTYTGPTTIQAGSLLLTPNAITNAAPVFSGTSMINLGGVGVSFGLDNAGATGAISVGSGSIPVNFLARDTMISTTRNADFASTLDLGGTVTRAAGATGIFNFINNIIFQPSANDSIITSNKILIGGSTGVIDQGIYITSGNMSNPLVRTDFAYRDAAGFVRNVSYGVDAGTALSSSAGFTSGGNLKVTGSVTNSVSLAAGASATTLLMYGQNSNLTLTGTNVISGILRTASGTNPNAVTLYNGQYAFTNLVSTISGGTIDSGSRELVIRADGANDWLQINSIIAGSAGMTRVGSGALIIGGSSSNTYTGTTVLTGPGTIYLNKTGGATALTGNLILGDSANAQTLQFGLANNSNGLNNQIATSSVVTFNAASTISLNGSSQTLAGIQNLNNSAAIIQNGSATALYSSTLTLNTDTDYSLGAASTLRDSTATGTYQYGNLALVKNGAGKLTVGVINNSGGITVNAGVLALAANTNPAQVGIGTGITTPGTGFINVATGATLDLNGFDYTGDYLTGGGVITNTSTAAKTLIIGTFDNTNLATGAAVNSTWNGVISDGVQGGSIVLQKRGHGTQTFTTAQNFSGGLSIAGGTLVLDMSGMATPTNLIRSANALTLAGTLSVIGKNTGTSSQTFNGLTLQTGASDIIVNANGGTSTTVTLGTITRTGANATIDFSGLSASQIVNTSTANTNGIIGGYATYNGVDWATGGGNIGQYIGYTTGLPTSGASATVNYVETSTAVTTTAGESVYTLKLAPATTTQTITLGGILTIAGNGLLYDNSTAAAIINNNGTATNTLGASGAELIVTTNGSNAANTLTINALIGGGTTTLTKAGTGTLVLGGNNAFTGVTRVNEGTVSFATVAAAGTAQPLGAGSVILGSGNRTGTLNYTGATATTWTQAIALAEGGYGQFKLTNGAASTLTVGGVISGGGGLILATPTTTGSGIILSGTNTYLGTTTVQTGARLTFNNNAALGASGTLASGTVVQSGGDIAITGNVGFGNEILTIAGTGTTGNGAVLIASGSTDLATLMKYVILSGNATVGSAGGTIRQIGIANGFIKGNGNSLTFNDTNFSWLTNLAVDNTPVISVNGGLVIEKMTLNSTVNGVASSGHTLLMTGTGKQIQLRSAVLDRATTWTNAAGGSINFGSGDNYVTQNMTFTAGTGTFDLFAGSNAGSAISSLTFTGNLIGVAGTNLTIGAGATKGGVTPVGATNVGNTILSGTGNVFGTLTVNTGTIKIMPIGGTVTNPISSTANVVFAPIANNGGVASPMYGMYLSLDNSKATGAVSQTFNNLTTTNGTGGSVAPSITLNNTTGQNMALVFGGTLARAAGSEILVNITGTNTTPSATNRIDIAGIGTNTISQGIFYNGADYALRDTTGGAGNQYLRTINYGADTAVTSSLIATNTALTNAAYTKIIASRTGQTTETVASLAFGNGGNLALAGGATLTVTSGGLLKSGGGAESVISGGTTLALGNTTTNSGEAIIRTDKITDLLKISSAITVNGTTKAINKLGMGRLTLDGNSSATLTAGTINIQEGTLRVTAATGGLGANAVAININNAAALEIDGSAGAVTIGNAIGNLGISGVDTSGFMNQSTGSIRNIAGNNIISGAITHPGFSRINSDAGTLTFTGGFGVNSDISFGGYAATPTVSAGVISAPVAAGNIVINSALANAATPRPINKDGSGTLTLKLTAQHTIASTFNIRGTEIWDAANIATNMLGTTAIMNMNGGSLILKSAATNTTQTIATASFNDGVNRISVDTTAGGTETLTLASVALPNAFGTLNFGAGGSYLISAGTAAAANNGIMGNAANNGFATFDNDWAVWSAAATPIAALASYTPLPTSGALATTNYSISANTTVNTTQLGNSLKADTSGGNVTLTLNSGVSQTTNALLVAGSNNFTITGGGTFGSTTVNNYIHHQGSGTLVIDTALADNSGTAGVALIIGGTGTGGINITSGGSINLSSNTNTVPVYFMGGTIANPRNININGGAINYNSKGNVDVGHGSGDNVVLTLNTGAINLTASTGQFRVGVTSGGYGKYVQNGGTFTSSMAAIFGSNNSTSNPSGSASMGGFEMHGGTFTINSNWLGIGQNGFAVAAQDGGTINVSRPSSIGLFISMEGIYGGTGSYTMSGGALNINGSTIIGGRNGASGTLNVSGTSVANFYQGMVLGMQDFAQGSVTQTGGTVNIGTGKNISDSSFLFGNNTIDLVLAYNQTTQAGRPSLTQGTYNLNGGELRVNGITTGQGNGYVSGADTAAGTYTNGGFNVTTTAGGTATFNWGGGTLRAFDSDLTVGNGVNVNLTAAGSTVNTDDVSDIARLVTFNTPITGAFGLTQIGDGVLLFNGVNTYAGDTTIMSGTLKPGVAGAIPSGAGKGNIIMNSGATSAGTLDLNGLNVSINGLTGDSTNAMLGQVVNNVNGSNVTFTVGNNNQTSTFNGLIKNNNNAGTGTLALTKTGTGTFILGGTNSYTGATTVNDGALYVNGALSTSSAVTVAAGKTFGGNGSAGAVTVGTGGTISIGQNGTGTGDLTLTGLAFSGTGTINFRNVQDGGTAAVMDAGVLVLSGGTGSISVNVGAGSGAWANGTFYKLIGYTSFSGALTDFTLVSPSLIPGLSSRQTASLFNDTGAKQIQLQIVGDAPKWTGALSTEWSTNVLGGPKNWALITGGTPTDFITGDQVLFDDTATSFTVNIADGLGGANVTPSSVDFNNSVNNYILQSTAGFGITGATGLLKRGTGSLTINNANTFTGGVTINGGKIIVGNVNALGASSNTVAFGVASNGTLQLNNNSITIGGLTGDGTAKVENGGSTADSILTVGGSATSVFGGVLQNGAGSNLLGLTTAGTGTLALTGANTYTGGTIIGSGSTLRIGDNGTTGSILGNVTDNGSFVFNRSDSVTFSGTVTGTGTTTISTGTLVLTGSLNNSGANTVNSGATLQVGNGVTNGSVGNVTVNGTVVFALNGTPLTYASTVSGTGALTVSTGTLVLTGTLSNSGADTINSGAILQIGDGVTNGAFSSDVTDNGTLTFKLNATPVTYANVASGTGSLGVDSGTLILTNGNNYSGGTTIASGATLQLGNNGTTGSITGDVTDNGLLVINRSGTASFNGNIIGTGGLSLIGTGTVTLSGTSSTYSGATTIARGTLKAGNTNVLSANSQITIGGSGTTGLLDLNGFNQTAQGIAATGVVTNQIVTNNATTADAILTLIGNSNYAGRITNGASKKTGVAVTSGGQLTLSGLASLNTYTGTTAIQNGTLKIGATGAGTSASVVVLGASGTNGVLDLNGFNGGVGGLTTDPAAIQANQLVGNSANTANTLTITTLAATTNVFGGIIQNTLGINNGQTTGLIMNGVNATTSIQALTGTNTYTGATTITQGVLQIGNGATTGALGATAVDIAANGVLQYNRTDTATFGSVTGITGAGAIALTGGGTLDTSTTDGIINTTGALNFGNAAGSTILGNLAVNGNTTVGSVVVQTNAVSADTLTIATGKTLTVTGAATIGANTTGSTTAFATSGGSLTIGGGLNAGTVATGGTTTNATFTNTNLTVAGAVNIGSTTAAADVNSTVTVSGGSAIFNLGGNAMTIARHAITGTAATGAGLYATLDLSSASSVQINGTAGSSILIGSSNNDVNGTGNADVTQGFLKLSNIGTNTVSATTITLGSSPSIGGAGIQGYIVLGNNTNTFQADTIYVGRQKSQAGGAPATAASLISFAGSGGTWNLSGLAGAKTALNIGYNDPSATGTITTGNVDLTGGAFNGTLSTVTIGFYNTGVGTGGGKGTLTIAGGTTTADAVVLATAGGSTVAANNQGTLNLNGGTLTLAALGTGITNGGGSTVTGTATLNLAGGTLDMNATNIGAAGVNTVIFNAQSGTLKNLAQLNGGSALTKTTTGTLILDGTNTYTGGTVISAGTVQVGAGSTTGTLGSGNVANGGTLAFNRNNTLSVSNIITGNGAVNQMGSGTTALTAASTYSGGTTVSSGVLLANNVTGSATGSGAIAVGASGTLGGTGNVTTTGVIVAGLGTLRPGDPNAANGIGSLAVTGNVTLAAAGTSVLDLQITHTNGVDNTYLIDPYTLNWAAILAAGEVVGASDHLNISGAFTINTSGTTTVNFSAADAGTFTAGMAWDLVDWGSISDTTPARYNYNFAALTTELNASNLDLDTSHFSTNGYIGVVAIVPEPSRVLLLMFGFMALFFRRRRRSSL